MVGIPSGITVANSSIVQFAVDTIIAACRLPLAIQSRGELWSRRKDDGSRVTEADYAVQAYVARELSAHFPDDTLVAEENSSFLKSDSRLAGRVTSHLQNLAPELNATQVISWVKRGEGIAKDRFWLLDPIDSTRGFLVGGLYCLNLALIENGQAVLGVIGVPKPFLPWFGDPLTDSGYLYVAVREAGAWWTFLDGSLPFGRLSVSHQGDVTQAIRMKSLSKTAPDQSESDLRRRENVSRALGEKGSHIRCPAPMRYPLLASGQGDLYVHLDLSKNKKLKSWDHAAGSLLVREAGGRVTDLEGKDLDFSCGRILARNRGLMASNGLVHDAALHILNEAGEGPLRKSRKR